MTTPPQLVALARKAAAAQSLDPALVCAVIEQESSWNMWAMRYEPAFFAKYVARLYTTGKISATEAYARGMSWGLCISAGELVPTEAGWQPIESITPGTRVLNRQGMLTKVRAAVRNQPANCLEVAVALNLPLRLTADHLVFARKATLSKWHTGRNRVLYDRHPDYIAASTLSPWDQVAFPRSSPTVAIDEIDATQFLKPPEGWRNAVDYTTRNGWLVVSYKGGRERCRVRRHIPITKEFLELVGLYIAEGHRLEKGKGCAFSFHAKERSLHARVIELATKVFGETPNHGIQRCGPNGVQVVLYGVGPRLLTEIIRGTAKTKQVPGWILWLPPEKQKYLFLGAFLGDGCRKYAKLTTASANVAYGLAHILLRLGIVPRVSTAASGRHCWYDVQLNSHSAVSTLNSQLGNIVEWVQTSRFGLRRTNSPHWNQDSDFVYFPVRQIRDLPPRPVFDLDAGEDSSFCVGRSIVHNCQVMGQVAREMGFDGTFLSALCDPEQGLAIGCKLLRKKLDAMDGDVTRGLLAWNGGGNPAYPGQVLARRAHYL
jgi:hypothetical protein